MICLVCGKEVEDCIWGYGEEIGRDCPSCYFILHIFRKPVKKDGIEAGGWTYLEGFGLGTYYPWGVLPVIGEVEEG